MRTFSLILFLSYISLVAIAQQVTQVDCCLDVGNKATIVMNNTTNLISTNSVSSNIVVNNNGICNFKLNASANTSAGVYNASGNLVRTLWSGVRYDAGCYNVQWDGNLDDGTAAPFGSYTVRILTNNVQYAWEGVIGNTSKYFTGANIYRGDNIYDICFVGNKGFFAAGGSERGSAQRYFTTDSINVPSPVIRQTTQSTYRVCTDGTTLYYAGVDDYTGTTFIYGAYPADNANPYATQVPFSSGVPYSTGLDGFNYTNAVGVVSRPDNSNAAYHRILEGFDVQINGNGLLFSSSTYTGFLQVMNKNTGATLQTISMPGITAIKCDNGNGVYISHGGVIEKFTSNSDGTLTATGTTIPSLTTAGVIAVNADFTKLAVADNSTNQVKIYTLPGLTLQSTLGSGVSYASNPYTADNKFFSISFISFQPDGKIWVGDPENNRYERFNADLSYNDQISYIGGSDVSTYATGARSSKADRNDPAHIFAGEVEYVRDYSKTLDNGTNGSWRLYANWKPGTLGHLDPQKKFSSVVTLSNGRRYATASTNALFELAPAGAVLLDGGFYAPVGIEQDGTIFTSSQVNGQIIITKNTLTGFDNSHKPLYGNPSVFATSPIASQYTPWNVYEANQGTSSTADRYVFFNNNIPSDNNQVGYHLGAVKTDGTVLFKGSRGTNLSYQGDYPHNGDFDIGNGPGQHSSTHAYIYGDDIFWNVNCEFWGAGKSSQPQNNIWNQFNKDGLFIGQFGLTGQKAEALGPSPAGMAGNALYCSLVKVGSGYYVYHPDESYHAGVHSWHVTGLNTVSEQTIPLTVSAAITLTASQNNLLAGLPFMSTFSGGYNWAITNDNPSNYSFKTGQRQYLKDSVDIAVATNTVAQTKRFLSNATLGAWTLTGSVSFDQSQPTLGGNQFNYLDIKDQAGKVIARFQENAGNNYYRTLIINSTTLTGSGTNADFTEFKLFRDFSYTYNGNNIVFKIGKYPPVTVTSPFETGADMTKPGYVVINQSSPGNQYHQMNLYKLKFVLGN